RIPASVPSPEIVMGFVIVTVPKPPGSNTEISPKLAVFEIAPAEVLHGAVRLHGFTSSPTPETHVRVAWAWPVVTKQIPHSAKKTGARRSLDMNLFLRCRVLGRSVQTLCGEI